LQDSDLLKSSSEKDFQQIGTIAPSPARLDQDVPLKVVAPATFSTLAVALFYRRSVSNSLAHHG
jgi:hypothetical protein